MATDSKPQETFDVVISGASFAGLALARALAVSFGGELRAAVIDRSRLAPLAAAADPRAFAITAATRRMLQTLGVWAHIEPDAQAVDEIAITDSGLDAGVRPILLRYDNHFEGEPATHIVPAPVLQSALLASVAASDGVTVLAPESVHRFSAGPAGCEIQLASGGALSAHLLVAADGRRSPLREAAGIGAIDAPYRQRGIVTTIAHSRPHDGRAIQHFLPGGPFAILPLPGDRSCITWSETEAEATRILALADEPFLAEIDRRVGGRLGRLTLVGPRANWPLEIHLARAYVADRFALVGDAAHVVHPIAGQGLNLALRDVAALAEVVADAVRLGFDAGHGPSLRRYERWRRFDSALGAAAFDALNRLFSNDVTLLRSTREFGLGLVDRLPTAKAYFVKEAAGLSGQIPKLLLGERI